MTTKYIKWKLWRPSGYWETWKLPRCFDVYDVQSHANYSEIWMYCNRGTRVHVYGERRIINGPCWAHYSPSLNDFDSTCGDPEKLSTEDIFEISRRGETIAADRHRSD